jgi:MFS family permease
VALVALVVYASVVLYGVTYGGVPPLVAGLVSSLRGARGAAGAYGSVTMGYSLGQAVGPAVAGALIGFGDFGLAYAAAAGLAMLAMVLVLLVLARPFTSRSAAQPPATSTARPSATPPLR